ncbi:MAG: NADH-quinone oxidoreductase subunit NuoF [Elusimicrobiota bacterium]
MKITNLDTLNSVQKKGLTKFLPDCSAPRIAVGLGTCGIGNGAQDIYEAFRNNLGKNLQKNEESFRMGGVYLTKTGCFGFCAQEPLVNVYIPGKPLIILHLAKSGTVKDVNQIVKSVLAGNIPRKNVLCKIEQWDHLTSVTTFGKGFPEIPNWYELPFFKWQKKIVLRNCGLINPEDIEEYIAVGGYYGLYKVLNKLSPDEVISELKKSKLRGRGGAGFPTYKKWDACRNANFRESKEKNSRIFANQKISDNSRYVICNADEGDPGAYMNRNEIESDPHSILEGIAIGGYAMGATEGVIYVRAEYPLAVQRLEIAIEQAKQYGLLGENIFNSGFNFNIDIVEGAGAFVCGEETALIASIEGMPGKPRPRPPFPAQKGLWGQPTNINNVETWCNIPVIIAKGGHWLSQIGTENSVGTKVFSLVGKIKNTGLVELPLGSSLSTIVHNIGEGTGTNKKVKAVQIGGPSGGCIPAELLDTSVDYESLSSLGSIMGSGGIVVMDEDNCMVDIARYFTEFTTSESCGKCVPCREGLYQALKILKSITEGKFNSPSLRGSSATAGRLKQSHSQNCHSDILNELETLCKVIKDTALCGLGQTAPNPILTTLKYFMTEYEEHIKDKKCQAGICKELIQFVILSKKCIGCGLCRKNCPVQAITVEHKKIHIIDKTKCTKCGVCFEVCKFHSIKKI